MTLWQLNFFEGDMHKIKNFRDVGCSINEILGFNFLKPCVLYRSGALDDVSSEDDLPKVKTIVNLRREEDPEFKNIRPLKAAPLDTMNNYVITSEIFQEWIQRLYNTLSDSEIWPLLMHCTGGKDRTGVVIALLLKNLGVSDDAIVKEYMRGDHGNRYPESMERLLREAPKIAHLKIKESQMQVIKKILLHE
jgi:protein-tyrosine phosphatase